VGKEEVGSGHLKPEILWQLLLLRGAQRGGGRGVRKGGGGKVMSEVGQKGQKDKRAGITGWEETGNK
jgi:hypothetical protein